MSCVTWHLLLLGRAQPLCAWKRRQSFDVCWLFPQHPALQQVKGNMETFSSLYLHPCLSAHTYTGCDILYLHIMGEKHLNSKEKCPASR